MLYKMEIKHKLVSIEKLMEHYNLKKVEEYCSNCNNYKKIWSCPPHDFNSFEYLNKYKYAHIVSAKIILNKKEFTENHKEEIMEVFQEARRNFGNRLIESEKENSGSEALIAGNCYQCSICMREINEPCILSNKRRYSLESLGLMVSSITSEILNEKIQWMKDDIPDYLLTVGALLINEKKLLKI